MGYSNFHEIYKDGVGLKVLLVDKDTKSLMYMSRILEEHSYKVTTTTHASVALSMIFERPNMFDLIITEIDMPGMDGFKLLKQIASTVDIATILISTMEDMELTRKALNEGASFFFHKPIAPHNLVNVWQHVLRYRMEKHQLTKGMDPKEVEKYLDVLHGKRKSSHLGEMPLSMSREVRKSTNSNTEQFSTRNGNYIGESSQLSKRGREDDSISNKFTGSSFTSSSTADINQDEENQKRKTPRMNWTLQLQQKFKESYEALGEHRATPSRIKELMNVPEIATQHISSYLQKFRARRKAQKYEATKHKMPTYMPNNYSSRQLSWPNYSNIHTTGNLLQNVGLNYYNIPTTEHSTLVANASNSIPNSSNIDRSIFGHVVQGNFGPGLQPLEPNLPTWANQWQTKMVSPNSINLQNNREVSEVPPLRNPQVVFEELNGGLGMPAGDNTRASAFVDAVPEVRQQNCGVGMERDTIDMDQEMTAEDIQNLLQQFSDDDDSNTLYGSSPDEGNVSSC